MKTKSGKASFLLIDAKEIPNKDLGDFLWQQVLGDEEIVEKVPIKEQVSGKVFSDETEERINSNRGIVGLCMNEKGEIKII